MTYFFMQGGSKSGGESTDSGSGVNTISSKSEPQFEFEPDSPISNTNKKASSASSDLHHHNQKQLQQEMASGEGGAIRTGPSSQNQPPAKSSQEKVTYLFSFSHIFSEF